MKADQQRKQAYDVCASVRLVCVGGPAKQQQYDEVLTSDWRVKQDGLRDPRLRDRRRHLDGGNLPDSCRLPRGQQQYDAALSSEW